MKDKKVRRVTPAGMTEQRWAEIKAESKARLASGRKKPEKPPKKTYTKEQRNQWVREWREKNKDKAAQQNRDANRRRKGGDTGSTTHPMPMFCEACGGPPSKFRGGSVRLAWDHDHETGKFRGWLCSPCNGVLGFLDKQPDRLAALMSYLRERG